MLRSSVNRRTIRILTDFVFWTLVRYKICNTTLHSWISVGFTSWYSLDLWKNTKRHASFSDSRQEYWSRIPTKKSSMGQEYLPRIPTLGLKYLPRNYIGARLYTYNAYKPYIWASKLPRILTKPNKVMSQMLNWERHRLKDDTFKIYIKAQLGC